MATKLQMLKMENDDLRANLAERDARIIQLTDENQFLLNKIAVAGKKTLLTKLRLKLGL